VQPVILYVVGAGAFAYGMYEYFRTGLVDTGAFTLAAICVVSAAGIQVVRDLWQRLLRRRR
jgi:hypothetical protein